MHKSFLLLVLLLSMSKTHAQEEQIGLDLEYLHSIRLDLQKKWPDNKTINLVFHGHSVPAGYFATPNVNTLDSYPYQVLTALKAEYPYAVINIINTSIGGENSKSGQLRFKKEVLNHRPDVLFIDYALNDRNLGLQASRKRWEKMIKSALKHNIKIILLTPSPDQNVDITKKDNILEQHAEQIRELAKKYHLGLIDSLSYFRSKVMIGHEIGEYMSQVNHPNKKGHTLIAEGILTYF